MKSGDGAHQLPAPVSMFLGFADYMSHERERPIAFVWRLRRAMPADFFRESKPPLDDERGIQSLKVLLELEIRVTSWSSGRGNTHRAEAACASVIAALEGHERDEAMAKLIP